jgi:LysM repeat protein
MLSPLKRPIGASSLGVAAACALSTGLLLTLASCGDNGGSAESATTVSIQPTSYVTRLQATTTTEPVSGTADTEGRSPVEQTYTVKAGDYPVLIAAMYDVPVDELKAYNKWEDYADDFPGIGETVRIPPGAKFIDASIPSTTTTESSATTEASDNSPATETTTADTERGPCDPGEYTVEPGDYPILVAEKFDLTVEELTKYNHWTPPDYLDFPSAGETVKIPPPKDCQ